MLKIFDFARDMSLTAIAFRLVLAFICGGLIGIEREYKRRPAGFRTHILICLGAAMTTLTSQYLLLEMGLYNDVARLGAGVIAGIGFIGAGTIIVTSKQRVKGLTTAAGLWTSAIIGLVCGAGYVECAIFATLMVLLAELLLIKIEYKFARKVSDLNMFIEYSSADTIEEVVRLCREKHVTISDIEITRVPDDKGGYRYHAVLTVLASEKQLENDVIKPVTALENVITVEEL
ncbi:MAG: MgtC/SapB family protein [Candidatus Limivicinus sp.]|jgi:putative Mg2+ transporter-C (MgtC) family protein